MSNIEIEFPDGAKKEFATATTVREVAATISNSLAKKAVGANFAGKVVGLNHQLKSDGKLAILTKDQPEALPILWQTGAVVLGAALQELYPEMYFGESDITEHGFFLDTDNQSGQVAETEFEKLNQHLQKLVKQALPLEEVELDLQAALKIVGNDPYRQELINEQATDDQKVTAIKLGDYYDFSVRAVLGNTAALKVFKLLSVAGAYWKGASSNPMLQRIYGTAFFKQKDLDAELARQKEAHERDHRVIGNELDLFFVDPKVGAGLPYWMPKGATIRRTIERYIIDKEVADGYQHVYTPVLANLDLYKQSGHWDHYREDMFPPMDMGDGEMLELRPMNCPSHIQIYNHHIRSYRELPLRIAELGMMHRYEKSGALTGLSRVANDFK